MKKLVLLLLLLGVIYYIFFNSHQLNPVEEKVSPTPTTISPRLEENIVWGNQSFTVASIKVDRPSSLYLIPNFEEKLSSEELIKNHLCRKGVNGNFYDKNNRPLGLFINEGSRYSEPIVSQLFNGYFSLDYDGNASISSTLEHANPRIALQSGPLLLADGESLPLKINNDESARRVVVATTYQNDIYFLMFYNQDSRFEGPKLSELPEIVKKSESYFGDGFKNALNLDGGSASVFFSDQLILSELSSVGSFFCIK